MRDIYSFIKYNEMQLILFIWFIFTTLHVSDAVRVHHQEYFFTNCSGSHWCVSSVRGG